jgi:hypothetical protein
MSSCVTSRHLSLSIVRCVPVLPMDPHTGRRFMPHNGQSGQRSTDRTHTPGPVLAPLTRPPWVHPLPTMGVGAH